MKITACFSSLAAVKNKEEDLVAEEVLNKTNIRKLNLIIGFVQKVGLIELCPGSPLPADYLLHILPCVFTFLHV